MLANTNSFVILLNVTAILSKILFGVKKNDFTEFFWPLTEGVWGGVGLHSFPFQVWHSLPRVGWEVGNVERCMWCLWTNALISLLQITETTFPRLEQSAQEADMGCFQLCRVTVGSLRLQAWSDRLLSYPGYWHGSGLTTACHRVDLRMTVH